MAAQSWMFTVLPGPYPQTALGPTYIPPVTRGHTHLWTFLPCKRKGNGWCRCILNFLEEASSKGTHYCLSLEEGVLPSVCREGLKGSWKTF